MKRLLLLGALPILVFDPSAQTGGIIGRVRIGLPITTPRASSAYASRGIGPAALAPESELRHVVVYLREAATRPELPVMRAEIRQHHESFTPRAIAVTIGSEVDFPNDDPFYHNVFSLSSAATFDLGRFPKGQSRSVRFDRAGLVKVFCHIHSHMSAAVFVFDHPWFAVPDADGRFTLSGIAPGDHHLTAWHERLGDTTLRVRVDPGRTAAADFVLPVPRS